MVAIWYSSFGHAFDCIWHHWLEEFQGGLYEPSKGFERRIIYIKSKNDIYVQNEFENRLAKSTQEQGLFFYKYPWPLHGTYRVFFDATLGL